MKQREVSSLDLQLSFHIAALLTALFILALKETFFSSVDIAALAVTLLLCAINMTLWCRSISALTGVSGSTPTSEIGMAKGDITAETGRRNIMVPLFLSLKLTFLILSLYLIFHAPAGCVSAIVLGLLGFYLGGLLVLILRRALLSRVYG